MIVFKAFLVGGTICLLAQLILDIFKITPAHLTCLFVFIGGLLEYGNIYDKLIKFSNSGALIPITSFGHLVTDAAIKGINEKGLIGLFESLFLKTSAGISAAIVFSVFAGLIFKPKS